MNANPAPAEDPQELPLSPRPSANRRPPPLKGWLGRSLARLWRTRLALVLSGAYVLAFVWLFSGDPSSRPGFAEALAIPEDPRWQAPDADAPFGSTGSGADLFELSRWALACSAASAVALAAAAAALALLLVSLAAFAPGRHRFAVLRLADEGVGVLPLVALAVFAAASGSPVFVLAVLVPLLALRLARELAELCEEKGHRPDVLAAHCLGLPWRQLVLRHHLRGLTPRLAARAASLAPRLLLLEMSLAFVGLGSGTPSCGAIIAHGREVMIEAPWVAIYPGLLATATVAAFAILGGLAKAPLKGARPSLWL